MGYSASEIIPRFEKYAGQPHGYEPGKGAKPRKRFIDGGGSSLYYRTDAEGRVVEIVSYGSHFPLATLIHTPGGKRKRWILNGDRWTGPSGFGRSNEHNAMMREAAQKGGTPWFIVPFSACREAGIDMGTIVPVDVAVERFTWEDHSAPELEHLPEVHRKHNVYHDAGGTAVPAPCDADGQEAQPDNAGGWFTWQRSALQGSYQSPVDGPEYEGRLIAQREEIARGADGLFHWSEQRHWLGESLFRASYTRWDREGRRDVKHQRYFLAAFDENEPWPLFFLAELPAGARPRTIAEAREALKPPAVRIAEQAGRTVLRQGDVFAIASALPTRDIPGPSLRTQYVLGVNHTATEVRTADGLTYARGFLRHRPPRRAEHRTVKLGTGWWLLEKNTVPMVHGQSRAWSMGGRVD